MSRIGQELDSSDVSFVIPLTRHRRGHAQAHGSCSCCLAVVWPMQWCVRRHVHVHGALGRLPAAAGVEDFHTHPLAPRTARIGVAVGF
jgi:hypothetical protein